MKKGILRLIALSVIAALIFVSCAVDRVEEGVNVQFSITNDRTRTVSSDSEHILITKYKFTLSGAQDYSETFEKNSSGKYLIEGVKPGNYTVKVDGLTASGSVISTASATVFLERGASETTKSFSITLSTLTGKQKASVVYKWTPSSYQSAPTLQLEIKNQKGETITVEASELQNDASAGKATLVKEFDAGSYIFIAKLISGSTVYIGHTEVFRFTNSSSMLSTEIDLTAGGSVTSESIVTEKIAAPITAVINNNRPGGQAAVDFTLTITSKPDGVNDSDIKVVWYNEERCYGGTTPITADKQCSFIPITGTSRITAVFWCDDIPGSMGSVSTDITYKR